MKKIILPIVILTVIFLSVITIGSIHSDNKPNDNKGNVIDKSKDDSISKKYIDNEKSKEQPSIKLSLEEAIELCKQKYGIEEDTLYEGENKIVEIDGHRGYLIQVVSKELMNQGGTGVLFSVIVSEDGNITEIE